MPGEFTSRSTSFTVTGLTNGTPYDFFMQARNNRGSGASTDWATATPAVPTPGFTVSPTSLTIDEGSSGSYTVKLDAAPSSNVVVTVGGESGDVTVSGSPLTFTPANYSTPQTVTVNAGGDTDTTDDTATLTHSYTGGGDTYSSISIDSVTVTVTDTTTPTPVVSTPGFTVSPTSLTIDEGSSGSYTVKLDAAPSSNVVVTVGGESGDVTVSGSPLTFTPANYSTPQTVTVNAGGDTDTTDDTATLTHSYTGGGDTYSSISIDSVTVTVTDTTTPGTSNSNSGSPSGGSGGGGGSGSGGSGGSGGGSSSRPPVEVPEQGQTPQPAKPTRPTVATTPVFQLLSDPADVREGEAINLMVTSSSPLAGNHTVRLTLSDRDGSGFTAADIPGSLGPRLFNAAFGSSASRSGKITIPTSRDVAVEGRERYRITLNSGSGYRLGNDVRADGTLLDPLPVFQLPTDPEEVTEGEAINLMVRSNSPLTGTHPVRLTLSDRDNSGFTAADIPGELGPRLFNAAFGDSASRSGVITISTSTDAAVEGRETYRIRLNSGSGYSLGTDVRADGMLLDPVPTKPTGLTATPGNEQVTLSWDDPQDASITGWQVQWKQDDGAYGSWEDIPNSDDTTTSYTVRGLRNGSRYEFRLRAVNGVGAGEPSDPVTATPFDPDAAQAAKARKAALTGLSRATLSGATDVIGGRISSALITTTASDSSIGEQALGIVEDILGISDTALLTSLSMEVIGEQLWHQTFQLTPPPPATTATARTTADGEGAPATDNTEQQRNWALWGAGNLQRFSGDDAQESMSYEGNLKTAWLGIDQQFRAPWHGGVAASFALGKTDYSYERTSGEDAGGTIKSRVSTFYPYGSVQLNERLRLWGTAGVGFGELRHQDSSNADSQEQEQEGDLRMQLALVGFAQQLSSIGAWDFSLAR